MEFPNLLKWKYSSVIIVGTGALLFWAGYRLGLIRDGELDSREEQLYALILTVTIPTGLVFSSAVVNREIQEVSQDEIQKAKKERDRAISNCNGEIGRFQNLYSQRLDSIKMTLEPLQEFEDIYQQCLLEIENCQAVFEGLKERSKAAANISDWLSSKINRTHIRDFAISEVGKKFSIPTYQKTVFCNDIGRCINWLRDSIFALQGYEVRQEELARASQDLPGGIDVYLTALTAIKSYPDLTRLSRDTNVLQDFVKELSERLQNPSN
jgi:hypothetical protein